MRSIDELPGALARRGGIMRASDLRLEGFTTHGIRRAIAEGVVERVRAQWLAHPECAPELKQAARVPGRLTCLTEARRLGLWTPDDNRLHVAVARTAGRIAPEGLKIHWARGPMPVANGTLADPVVNVLFHVARCAPRRDALAVWESALRARRVDAAVLARISWRSEAARALAALASVLSDSGVETRFVLLMRSIGVAVAQQVRIAGHAVDGLIGEKLIVQLDGFAHHRAAERRRDLRHDAALALRGFTVLRFDYYQVFFEPEDVIATVSMALAQGLHR